jgi:hypothetical protein
MRSPEKLRAEVRRLHLMLRTTLDLVARRKLAEHAMELAQEAEAVANLPSDAEGLDGAITHYKHMLANADNPSKQQMLVHVLQRAEGKLQQLSSQQRTSRPHRLPVA